MRVLVLNGYSALNRGDGLLAELAAGLCVDAFGPDVEVVVAAHDPDSFTDAAFRAVSPFGTSHSVPMTLRGLLALATAGRSGFSREFIELAAAADILVSVGGAYLRGGRVTELFKSMVVHGGQVSYAARLAAGKPWIMLPQSIGPFPKPVSRLLQRKLAKATRVLLRDDKSVTELDTLTNSERTSDCAVLAVAARPRAAPDPGTTAENSRRGLILRRLPEPGRYEEAVRLIIDSPNTWVPIVQSARGGNDDRQFYSAMGVDAVDSLSEAIAGSAISSCLSVRLHGALESIMSGVPAVHLSYERKGFAAFRDLGLQDFVFDARDFDADDVLAAMVRIESDPEMYWTALGGESASRVDQRTRVVALLRDSIS